jgi:hypothetical protein
MTKSRRPPRPQGENENITVSIMNNTSLELTPVSGSVKMQHGKISSQPVSIPPGQQVQAFVAEGDLDSFFGTQGQLQYQVSATTLLTIQFNVSFSGDNDYVYAGLQPVMTNDDISGFSAVLSNYYFQYVNVMPAQFQFFPVITVANSIQNPGPLEAAYFSGPGTDNWIQYILTIDNQTTSPMTLNEVMSPLGNWMQPNVLQVVMPQSSAVAIISFGGTDEIPNEICLVYNMSDGITVMLSYNPQDPSTAGGAQFSTNNDNRFAGVGSTPTVTVDGNGNTTYSSTFTISFASNAERSAPPSAS